MSDETTCPQCGGDEFDARPGNPKRCCNCGWTGDEAHAHVSEVDGSPHTFAGQVIGKADAALAGLAAARDAAGKADR